MQNLVRVKSISRQAIVVDHPASLQFNTRNTTSTTILLPCGNIKRVVDTCEIAQCTSESNYCNIVLVNGDRIFLAKTLKWVEDRLPIDKFIRTHSSHLVNIEEVTEWSSDRLTIQGASEVPIARRRKTEVHRALEMHFSEKD